MPQKRTWIFFLLLNLFALSGHAQRPDQITPIPVHMEQLELKAAVLGSDWIIYADPSFEAQAAYLAGEIKRQTGISLSLATFGGNTGKPGIFLLSKPMERREAYELEVKPTQIQLTAGDRRGIVNGIQTLLQLIPLEGPAELQVPACKVVDYPRFAYRGMHLDVVRHIFPLEYIRKYIDYLAFHKFNTFHWHLTDDQGWRIEIRSYPKLNSIGSWRDSTLIGHFRDSPMVYDKTRYGGFYTREEVKEILAYAEVRGITVVPEIDIPGHSRATITAYPELSTDPSAKWGVAATWGMYNRQNNVLAPNPETFRFLRTVFHEIAELFPSEYIHLGGDECSRKWWKESKTTQAFMRENGLSNEVALQTYFIEQAGAYLREKNKKVIGWHEIMEGKLDSSTIVMNWSNDAKAIEAASRGFSVIQTPGKPYYFDHYQSKNKGDSLAIHGYNPLAAVYAYDPLPPALVKAGLAGKLMGGQANVWTEYMGYSTKVDYMVLPRMTAVSESLWSQPGQKNYADFLRRLKSSMLARYKLWNSSWFPDFEKWPAEN